MSRIAYANRQFMPQAYATTPIEDRGLQFSDGVYEVMEYLNQYVLDRDAHLDRLEQSLQQLSIPMPMSRKAMELKLAELIRQNQRRHGLLYLQINRGAGMRDHAIKPNMKPVMMLHILPRRTPSEAAYRQGIAVVTAEDIRWQRCDVKTVSLLGAIMLKHHAATVGAKDVVALGGDGTVRESSSSNLFMVTREGELQTPKLSRHLLPGITRQNIIRFAAELGIPCREVDMHVRDLASASELFITNTSSHLMPVTRLDGKTVSETIGPISTRLLNHYHQHIERLTGELCPILA